MKIRRTPLEAAFSYAKWLLVLLTFIFMVAPAILVIVLSFSDQSRLIFPPTSWGLRQYSALFGSDYYMRSIAISLLISLPAALVATTIGIPATIALERSHIPGRSLLRTLGVAPIVLPGAAYAVALYLPYAEWHVLGSFWGLILAEATQAVPFIIMIVGAGLRRIPRDLQLAAMSLGASRVRATFGITLRLLLPSIGAAMVLAFVTVFDEVVLVNFLGNGQIVTLPKAVYDSFRTGIDPLITAIATLLMLITGVLMFISTHWRKGNVR